MASPSSMGAPVIEPLWHPVFALVKVILGMGWIGLLWLVPLLTTVGLIRLYAFLESIDAPLEYLVTLTFAGAISSLGIVVMTGVCWREFDKLTASAKKQLGRIRRRRAQQAIAHIHQREAETAQRQAPRKQVPSP